jgi:hypothetical protein
MTVAEIVNAALNKIGMRVDIAHNQREMLRLLNRALDEIDNDNIGEK